MNSYPIGWRRMESRMKNWPSLHYYTENILYSTLYTVKLKIYTQRFYCSSSKFSKFIQGKSSLLQYLASVCLFAKGEVKNLSKVDWNSLFCRTVKVIQTLAFNQGTKSVHFSSVGMPLCSQRLKLFPVVQHILNVTCCHSSLFISLTFRYTSVIKSEAAYVIRLLTSRCLERKQPSRVGGSPLCDVVSSFLCHTHTYILTYSIQHSPSWEANWFAASQEIPPISRNPKVHYRTHKRPPPFSILGQPNPVHIHTSHFLEIHPNIIRPSTPRSPQWSPSLRFHIQTEKISSCNGPTVHVCCFC